MLPLLCRGGPALALGSASSFPSALAPRQTGLLPGGAGEALALSRYLPVEVSFSPGVSTALRALRLQGAARGGWCGHSPG